MGNTPSFTSVVESRNGVAHVALAGELDLATVSEFSRSLEGCHWGAIDAIILDLRNLSFVDSTGLQAVLEARSRAQANQRRLVLIGAQRQARRLCQLTRTEFLLEEADAVGVVARFIGGTVHGDPQTVFAGEAARA